MSEEKFKQEALDAWDKQADALRITGKKEFVRGYLSACRKREAEITRLRQALEDVVDPIGEIKRLLKPGEKINGPVAIQLSNDPYHLKKIAEDALEESK